MQSTQQNITEVVSSPTPRKNILAKAAIFDKKDDKPVSPTPEHVRKQLDPSKTAFLSQMNVQETDTNSKAPQRLSQHKLEQYSDRNDEISNVNQVSICVPMGYAKVLQLFYLTIGCEPI